MSTFSIFTQVSHSHFHHFSSVFFSRVIPSLPYLELVSFCYNKIHSPFSVRLYIFYSFLFSLFRFWSSFPCTLSYFLSLFFWGFFFRLFSASFAWSSGLLPIQKIHSHFSLFSFLQSSPCISFFFLLRFLFTGHSIFPFWGFFFSLLLWKSPAFVHPLLPSFFFAQVSHSQYFTFFRIHFSGQSVFHKPGLLLFYYSSVLLMHFYVLSSFLWGIIIAFLPLFILI